MCRSIATMTAIILLCLQPGYGKDKTKDANPFAKQLSTKKATVKGFTFNPPKGWQKRKVNAIITAWIGKERTDGTKPHMLVTLIPSEPVPDLESFLKKMLKGLEDRRTEWKQSKFKTVKQNGMTFLSAEWTGKRVPDGVAMAGVVYVSIVGDTAICITSQDMTKYAKETSGKAVAALETFKK